MNIAYVCADPGVPTFGRKGASVHVQEMLRAFSAQGAKVTLFTPRPGGDAPADLDDVKLEPLPPLPKGDAGLRERAALEANKGLLERLNATGPFDLVYERYSLWGDAGMRYARERGVPGLLEVNAPLIEEQLTYRELVHVDEAQRVAERTFGAAAALLPVSQEVANYLLTFEQAASKTFVVPNGVNVTRFSPEVTPSLPDARFTVGFVGTLKPWHGLNTLLSAFQTLHAAHPDSRLLIVGDGPERERLERGARPLGDAVTFTGKVAPDAVPGLLRSVDVATAPYPALETFYFSPLKVYEYLAAGVPVVASRVGQLETLLTHGKTGLLHAPGDASGLAAALARLKEDVALRTRLAQRGRAEVLAQHSWQGVAARVLDLARFMRTEVVREG